MSAHMHTYAYVYLLYIRMHKYTYVCISIHTYAYICICALMRACSHLRRRRHLQIDRVTFGLLSTAEHEALLANEPHMPRSRVKLAIPFLGKDCPSRASEFAHP